MKYGLLEHCGTKENQYPIVLSNDKDLQDWIAKLQGKGVYIGVQAEWIDWVGCFSKEVFSQLDYVLTDSWTVRDANGKRVKAFAGGYDPGNDAEAFMKWYVDWIVEILETTPLDIWSHPMWVTRKFTPQLEQMWTDERMRRVVRTLKNTNTAVEIDSSVKLPTMPFLKMAKAEGIKFSFGASSQGAAHQPGGLVDRDGEGTRPHEEGHVPACPERPEADPGQEAQDVRPRTARSAAFARLYASPSSRLNITWCLRIAVNAPPRFLSSPSYSLSRYPFHLCSTSILTISG